MFLRPFQFVAAQNLTFADGQGLAQNFIGNNQQSLNQLNYNQQYTIDLGSLASTNISNILQPHNTATIVKTSEGTVTLAVDQPTVTFGVPEVSEAAQDEAEAQPQTESSAQLNVTPAAGLVEQSPTAAESNDGSEENDGTEHANIPTHVAEETEDSNPETDAQAGTEQDRDEDYAPSEREDGEIVEEVDEQENVQPREPPEMGVGKRRYDCSQCNKTFNKAGLLREHIKTHAGKNSRR